MEPHHSHLSHKKTILMQETTADADSHLSHKNRQEAEETEGITVEVARAPGVNRRRSAHKTATHISVDLVIVLFRVDVTCHSHASQCLLYINSVHRLYNITALDQLPLSSQLVPST